MSLSDLYNNLLCMVMLAGSDENEQSLWMESFVPCMHLKISCAIDHLTASLGIWLKSAMTGTHAEVSSRQCWQAYLRGKGLHACHAPPHYQPRGVLHYCQSRKPLLPGVSCHVSHTELRQRSQDIWHFCQLLNNPDWKKQCMSSIRQACRF